MARRRQKRRTHIGAKSGSTSDGGQNPVLPASRIPKSMVIRTGAGEVGSSVSQLVKDFRHMMEPHTASRLRERRSNRLRDYTTMAGPLGVSHLILFSRSENGNINLRLALTPRGPTMHFRVESYSLCKDVKRAMKRPAGTNNQFAAPPLLVMNNFSSSRDSDVPHGVPRSLESLSTSVFQSLFPTISPIVTPLTSIQRVLLLNRETTGVSEEMSSYILNLRHYTIRTRRVGLPKTIRRINAAEKVFTSHNRRMKGLPNLGKLNDVSDYLLDPSVAGGFTSGSESEPETDAEIEILGKGAQKASSRKKTSDVKQSEGYNARIERRAIKLFEIGPRLRLRLLKIEEGVCNGKVLWHDSIRKSEEQVAQQEDKWKESNRIRQERKRQQNENVAKKSKAGSGSMPPSAGEDAMDEDDWDSEGTGYEDSGTDMPATNFPDTGVDTKFRDGAEQLETIHDGGKTEK